MKDFDVIIIGSGIGGLISAGILSAKGLKILLVEKNKTPGGYLASFRRGGFIFDSSVDCISGVAPGGLIFRVMELLQVNKNINVVQVDPIRISIFPDIKVPVDSDIYVYIERLTALFPSESEAIKKFFELLDKIHSGMQSARHMMVSGKFELQKIFPDILKFRHISYAELLDEYITDYKLKSILSDRCPFVGLPPSMVSALSMVNIIMSYFKFGAYRLVGGSQNLADAFVEGIKKAGGKVIFGNGTKKILSYKDGRCLGITCDNDDEYTARFIISNADFQGTFCNLLADEYTSIVEDMQRNIGISTSLFMVYAGITGSIEEHSSIGYFSSYNIEDYFIPSRAFKEDSTLSGITVASSEDKSRAPDLCHTVVFHEIVEASGEKLDKAKCTEVVMKKAENVVPGIQNRIIVLDSATPQTLHRYSGNLNGSAYGWRQIPGFRGVKRVGIKNFYIAGHWGDMGGGVLAAAYSGAKAAADICSEEGITIDF
jgi:phytoene dehydrogenase-like protein